MDRANYYRLFLNLGNTTTTTTNKNILSSFHQGIVVPLAPVPNNYVIEKLIKCFLDSMFKTTPVSDPFLL